MKKIIIFLTIILVLASLVSVVSATRILRVTDTFNRINSDDKGTSSDGNMKFIYGSGTDSCLKIATNENTGSQAGNPYLGADILNPLFSPYKYDASGGGINMTFDVTNTDWSLGFYFGDGNATPTTTTKCSVNAGASVDGITFCWGGGYNIGLWAVNGTTVGNQFVNTGTQSTGEYSLIVTETNFVFYLDGVLQFNEVWTGRTSADFSNGVYIYETAECRSDHAPSRIDNLIIADTDVDETPPTLSNAICTSCPSGTNKSGIKNPTINVTCIDDHECQMVRISNNSAYNFSNATSSRNCTAGAGDTWVCTLPTSDQLVTYDYAQPLYFWANDSSGNYHTVYNLTMDVTFIDGISPSYSGLEDNATGSLYKDYTVQFNISIADGKDLDSYTFSWNSTGTWVNFTTDISGTSVKVIENKTIIGFGNTGFTWYMNDTSGNSNQTNIFNFTVLATPATYLYLDGINESRTYEYETIANLTTDGSYIDILDDTGRYRNQFSPFNYTIDILRINQFNDTNTSKNVSSGSQASITIDNRTDLYNATFNLTGFTNPRNVTINSSGEILNFPGTLIGNNLYQNNFIHSGISQTNLNLTYSTAGSKTIYINYSNQGNVNTRKGNISFTVTAYDLDIGNDFNFTESFNNSLYINTSSLLNTSAPMSVFDDFESETPDRWSCTNVSEPPRYHCNLSIGNDDDYFTFKSSSDGGCGGDTDGGSVELNYAEGYNLDNSSVFNITIRIEAGASTPNYESYGSAYGYLYATDGTTDVELYKNGCLCYSRSGCSLSKDYYVTGIKDSNGNWDIYENGSIYKSDVSIISLNSPIEIKFKSISYASCTYGGGSPAHADTTMKIKDFKTSGIRLKRTDGAYDINVPYGTFESSTLFNSVNDISRSFLSTSVYNPEDTNIKYYLSNNNGSTYETIVPSTFHTFISVGKALKAKFILNSTDNLSSSLIYNYRIQIIPASPSGLIIDVGDDGTDINLEYELNSTTTPFYYNLSDSNANTYIRDYCGASCLIPISFITSSGGILQISNFNLTENINPIKLNTSVLQNLNSIPFKLTYTDGTVQLSDLKFDFRGSKNISVVAHSGDYSSSINRTIKVKYSPFEVDLPSGIDYFEIFYSSRNQSNAEPWGQNSSTGIFQITSEAYDGDIDIYSRYNSSPDVCLTRQTFRGQNFSVSGLTNISTLNITNLTTSNLPILADLNSSSVGNVRSYTMINCSEYDISYVFEYFCFNSLCSDCVFTSDWTDNCDVME